MDYPKLKSLEQINLVRSVPLEDADLNEILTMRKEKKHLGRLHKTL